jgi:hypothetical protein
VGDHTLDAGVVGWRMFRTPLFDICSGIRIDGLDNDTAGIEKAARICETPKPKHRLLKAKLVGYLEPRSPGLFCVSNQSFEAGTMLC